MSVFKRNLPASPPGLGQAATSKGGRVSLGAFLSGFFGRFSGVLTLGFFALVAFGFFFTLFSAPASRVLVSKHDVVAGQLLVAEDVEVVVWEGRLPADALVDLTSVANKRTVVPLPAGTPLRAGYFPAVETSESASRRRLSLPVPISVTQMLSPGDRIDIYLPQMCDNSNVACPPKLLSHQATVVQILKNDESGYGNSGAALVLDVAENDVGNLVSVIETSLLKYILIQ